MIVFGTRGRLVAGPRELGIVCESCGKEEHASYGALRYFHLFWIPVFPTMKKPMLECLHCKKVLAGEEIPEQARRNVAENVFTRARVLPLFTGLALIAFLVAAGAYRSAEDAKREVAFLGAPAVGDVYVVKLAQFVKIADTRHPYGVARVEKVGGENLMLQLGKFGYDRPTGASYAISSGQIAAADYFVARPLTVPLNELTPLKTAGAIFSVTRR